MIRRSLVLIGGGLLVGAASAYAQSSFRLDANIPFEFQVGKRTLPAGEYLLTMDQMEAPGVLTIRSRHGGSGGFLLVEPAETNHVSPQGKLVFERAGEGYVLSEVFDGGARVGLEVMGTHAPEERPQPTD